MGWYLKKSFAFGPLRLNLSKSGIGASVGVKGLRVSTGPKGKQLNAGRGGLYYRASLNSPPDPPVSDPESIDSDAETINNASSVGRQLGNSLLRGIFGGLMRGR